MRLKLSRRVLGLEASPTLAITSRAKELKKKGHDIVSFTAGEPDFDTPSHIKEAAIRAINEGHTKYTPVGGIDELKEAIIERYRKDHSLEYSKEEILVSCGGKHSFYNLCQALLDQGDEVIVPAPYWVSYPPMVRLAGGVPRIVSTDEKDGFKISPEELENAITEKTKAIVINSPSNPTGAVYSPEELKALVEIAVERGVLVVSDEIYDKLVYGEVESVCAAGVCEGARENTIVLNGVSKSYSMTGWRIGYALGPKELIDAMMRIQSQSTSNPTSISQWASVAAISGSQQCVEEMKREFKKRRDIMVDGLNSIEGISCIRPHGAFYVFANVSALFGRRYNDRVINSSVEFASFLLDTVEVCVVPGAGFGDDRFVRLSFACSEEDIKKGVERIREAVGLLR